LPGDNSERVRGERKRRGKKRIRRALLVATKMWDERREKTLGKGGRGGRGGRRVLLYFIRVPWK